MSYILGISAFYHDSAAALIKNNEILAAAQEERFSRIKHDSSYPFHAVEFVLRQSNIKLSQIDYIAFYEKPFLKFERLLETYLAFAPRGFSSFCRSMPIWLREKLFQKKFLFDQLKRHDSKFSDINKIYFSEHHLSHAASAFYPSPFKESMVLTLDGVGEWATTTVAKGDGNKLDILKEIHFPHSVGLLYSAFTYYTGFKVLSGEYKVMGLAPYGEPKYEKVIYDNLIDLKNDGTFKLNMEYFEYATGFKMTNTKFSKLFGKPVRNSSKDKLTQFHMDIAASIQSVTNEIVLRLVKSIAKEYSNENLCMAGGVALNCVTNGKIVKEKIFKNLWIQPAASDAGGALGAALALWYKELSNKRISNNKDEMKGSYLGPSYNDDQIEKDLKNLGAIYEKLTEEKLLATISNELSKEKTVGWFQGRMEFGPRALGSRSIIADPRSDNMQKILNLKIKFRESFRPFAPSIIKEDLQNWFDLNVESPYMLLVANISDKLKREMNENEKKLFGIDKLNIKRSDVPAVTHVDYSARIQTVDIKTNPKYYKLLQSFKKITGCPILINTSFNVRGEPIVCNVNDAYQCFMGTNLDILTCGNFILYKNKQNPNLIKSYKNKFISD
tara:strand:- start:12514 stop:14352 length:1839 start_codon:yes stop_codon:yes gene_type:complete